MDNDGGAAGRSDEVMEQKHNEVGYLTRLKVESLMEAITQSSSDNALLKYLQSCYGASMEKILSNGRTNTQQRSGSGLRW